MYQFIFDLLVVRGWSIRHLAELTGISYSGIRDHLKGLPHRLSVERLQRVYDILQLDRDGNLQPNTLYTWRIECGQSQLAALNRVLRVTLELDSRLTLGSETDSNYSRFEAMPLLGGGNAVLPAPYCVLHWRDIYIVVQWGLPTRQQKSVPNFHDQQGSTGKAVAQNVLPDLSRLDSVIWATGAEISGGRVAGIQLTPSQLAQLSNFDAVGIEPVTLNTLKAWLAAEPVEDTYWASMRNKKTEWTWDLILKALQHRYSNPEKAAKALRLL
jgi:transcriptional regulator with XRE-family HTH domain